MTVIWHLGVVCTFLRLPIRRIQLCFMTREGGRNCLGYTGLFENPLHGRVFLFKKYVYFQGSVAFKMTYKTE